jgi:hypothetical protein
MLQGNNSRDNTAALWINSACAPHYRDGVAGAGRRAAAGPATAETSPRRNMKHRHAAADFDMVSSFFYASGRL